LIFILLLISLPSHALTLQGVTFADSIQAVDVQPSGDHHIVIGYFRRQLTRNQEFEMGH
jgi:hypothetical protein